MAFPTLSTAVLVAETLLFLAIILGSYYGRLLDIDLHHRLIYPAIGVQLVITAFWMIPNSSFLRDDPTSPLQVIGKLFLTIHSISGLLALLLSIYLTIYFVFIKRKWEIGNLPLQRRLMIITLILWILAFLSGVSVYFGILIGY